MAVNRDDKIRSVPSQSHGVGFFAGNAGDSPATLLCSVMPTSIEISCKIFSSARSTARSVDVERQTAGVFNLVRFAERRAASDRLAGKAHAIACQKEARSRGIGQ